MELPIETKDFEFPLEFQFAMRRAELQAQEMTWDELYVALLNLYQQRHMEWQAVKAILAEENIELDFGIPSDLELQNLAAACAEYEDDDDDEDKLQPF